MRLAGGIEKSAETVPFPSRMGEPAEFASLALHVLTNQMINGFGTQVGDRPPRRGMDLPSEWYLGEDVFDGVTR